MDVTLSFLALVVATLALLVALLTHAKVSKTEDGDNPSVTADAAPPPFTQGRHAAKAAKNGASRTPPPTKGHKNAGAAKAAVPMSVEERRERAVLQKQHDNFMNYDGSEQTPIDPDTILADGGA